MGTLIIDPYREAVRAATGLDLEAVHRLKDPDAWPAFEVAAIDEAEFARRFFPRTCTEHTFDLAAFHTARREGYAFVPGMDDLLDDLAGRCERYIASNYPVWVEEIAERFALRERTDGIVASHHLGVRKPDPAFYERFLERIERDAADCLFVDDRQVNCEGAEAVGMRAHLFTDADDLRVRLQAEGVMD